MVFNKTLSILTMIKFSCFLKPSRTKTKQNKIHFVIVAKNLINHTKKPNTGKYNITKNFNLYPYIFIFSQFCTLAFCKECRYKTRKFPMSDEMLRGDVCKICDRKFFIKDMMKERQNKIDMYYE